LSSFEFLKEVGRTWKSSKYQMAATMWNFCVLLCTVPGSLSVHYRSLWTLGLRLQK